MTVYPGSEPEPPDRYVGTMPRDWKPTPPSLAQRAEFAARYAEELAEDIARAEQRGDRNAVFALTDRQSRELRKADQYARLASMRHDDMEPPSDAAPPSKTFVIGG